MQAVRPAAPGHLAPRELIHDDDFAVFYDIIHVIFVKCMGTQRLVDVVHDVNVGRIGHVGKREKPLALRKAFFRQRRGTVLFIERVINVLNQLGNDLIDLGVFVG